MVTTPPPVPASAVTPIFTPHRSRWGALMLVRRIISFHFGKFAKASRFVGAGLSRPSNIPHTSNSQRCDVKSRGALFMLDRIMVDGYTTECPVRDTVQFSPVLCSIWILNYWNEIDTLPQIGGCYCAARWWSSNRVTELIILKDVSSELYSSLCIKCLFKTTNVVR